MAGSYRKLVGSIVPREYIWQFCREDTWWPAQQEGRLAVNSALLLVDVYGALALLVADGIAQRAVQERATVCADTIENWLLSDVLPFQIIAHSSLDLRFVYPCLARKAPRMTLPLPEHLSQVQ